MKLTKAQAFVIEKLCKTIGLQDWEFIIYPPKPQLEVVDTADSRGFTLKLVFKDFV